MGKYEFGTIFTSNDVMNILDVIENGFESRERSYFMVLNDYFGPIKTNIPHATPNYGPGTYNFEVDYYRQKYFSPEKVAHIRKKLKESGQEVIYSSKCLNSDYMEHVGYETRDKLIRTSGEGCINKNTTRK